MAQGVKLRIDHGSQYTSETTRGETEWRGFELSYGCVASPNSAFALPSDSSTRSRSNSSTAAVPITADSRSLVSVTIAYGTDLTFYQDRKNVLISKSMGDLVREYFGFPTKIRGMVAGLLFPILLHFLDIEAGTRCRWPFFF